jgi:hypothetical protein
MRRAIFYAAIASLGWGCGGQSADDKSPNEVNTPKGGTEQGEAGASAEAAGGTAATTPEEEAEQQAPPSAGGRLSAGAGGEQGFEGLEPPEPPVSSAGGSASVGSGGAPPQTGSGGEAATGSPSPFQPPADCSRCRDEMCGDQLALCTEAPACKASLACIGECGSQASNECVLGCFNDDVDLALLALQLTACTLRQCGASCLED